MVKNNHLEKRYRLEGKITFYTSQITAEKAEKAWKKLELRVNKDLLTNFKEVIKIDLYKVEKLPF